MTKKLSFLLGGFLLLLLGCRHDLEQMDKVSTSESKAQKFSIFNFDKKTQRTPFDYAGAFAFLAQRYDSINHTNITGLVNTSNEVVYDSIKKQRFISSATEAYIEFRIHSQTIFEENGDIWAVFPKIENNAVKELVVAFLGEEETLMSYFILDKSSDLHQQNIEAFQSLFSQKYGKGVSNPNHTSKTRDIEEVVITVPKKRDGEREWEPPAGAITGDCGAFTMCIPDYGLGGGGMGNSTPPQNNNGDPCTKAKGGVEKANDLYKKEDVKNAQTKIKVAAAKNGKENMVAFGSRMPNGTVESTGVQEGNLDGGVVTNPYAYPVADIHNHPNNKPPSTGDVYSMMKYHLQHNTFSTRYVLSSDGTLYALVITDTQAIREFLSKYPPSITANPKGGSFINFPQELFEKYTDLQMDFSESGALSYILNEYNAGISLVKMDGSGRFRNINITKNTDSTYKYELCP